MKYICTLITVRDLQKSREFYEDVLEQTVVQDLGANVTLSGALPCRLWKAGKNLYKPRVRISCSEATMQSWCLR